VEILREELKKSEALLGTLVRRKADRLAASDPAGVTEVEEQHTRTLSDVAGLKRELAAATHTPAASSVEPIAAAKPLASARSLAAAKGPTPAPWWDVYGKTHRGESASPISLAPEPAPRPSSARRLE
jgi:hypothetical protein